MSTFAVDEKPGQADRWSSLMVEEVVVTARRRSEGLQQVPVAAAVVSGETIADHGITTLQDLSNTLPAVTLSKGSTTDRLFIRGIGSGDNPSFEQSVGTFVDDIYHGRARSSEGNLFDVERVEVLKGPQTTYFGNNAIAGALNVVTRDPGSSLSADLRAAYTPRFSGYTAEAAVDLPASSELGFRLAGLATGTDGWIHDLGTGEDVPRTRNAAARATVLWTPTSSFTARIKGQYAQEREQGGLPIVRSDCPQPAQFGVPSGFCAAAIAAGAAPYSADFFRNSSPGQLTTLDSQDYSATLILDPGAYVLTSVTGFSRYTYALDSDLDLTPLNLLSISAPERYRQFSQELRITSKTNGPFEWIGGLYYQHSRLNVTNQFGYGFLGAQISASPTLAPLVPYLPLGVNNSFEETNNTGSAFAALTWKPLERLSVTGATRYTAVDKDFDQTIGVGTAVANFGPFTPLPAAVAPVGAAVARGAGLATIGTIPLSRKDNQVSPSVSLQLEATEAVMLYAKYDHGFKAGGFNGSDLSGTASALPFAPEKVNAYEIGLKSRLFNDRATANIDVFRSNYTDLQLAGVVPSITGAYVNRVQNAGGAVSEGAEFDVKFRVTRHLRTALAVTYLDAYYTRYPSATPTALQTRQGLRVQDLSGQHTAFAPNLSGSWTLTYEAPLTSSLSFRIENRVFASGGVFLNPNNDPNDRQEAYAREDLAVALANMGRWELSITGQNLTNRVIRTYGAALPTSLGTYVFITEQPRNATIQAKYSF